MDTPCSEIQINSIGKDKRTRIDKAQILDDFKNRDQAISQREFAETAGVPPSTLRYWLDRKNSIDEDPILIEFFESPVGVAFLHRLVTAAHVCFTKAGAASIHAVSDFLERSGLSEFVGASYSSQRRVSERMNEQIIAFGKSEDQRLGREMPEKMITLCEDETFHPQTCLVAIEPEANFILVEKYAENRETATWNQAVAEALDPFAVKVIQVTSDQGRSLISHAHKGLNVHHSPDCFHVSYEVGKATSGALQANIKKAEKVCVEAARETAEIVQKKDQFDQCAKRPQGRRPNFEKRIAEAKQQENQAQSVLAQAVQYDETVREAKARIGEVYHPYNLNSGEKQDSAKVSDLLTGCFEEIHQATAALTERCKSRIQKAQRVMVEMVATIVFYFQMIEVCLENAHLSDRDKHLMHSTLIPGYYLKLAAGRERDVKRKREILAKAQELIDRGSHAADGNIDELKKLAQHCAQLFQRSSSCVEGRNAQLALRHQGIHRLGDKQLKALTVVHNYYIKRSDGTTAAERFFEIKPNDLFDYLLTHMDYPMRPRKRFKKAA